MKDDKKQIGNDAVKVTIAKIIAQALSMVVAMLMARFLTLEENGTYSQVILVINMVLSLFMLGLPNSMNYYMGRAVPFYLLCSEHLIRIGCWCNFISLHAVGNEIF